MSELTNFIRDKIANVKESIVYRQQTQKLLEDVMFKRSAAAQRLAIASEARIEIKLRRELELFNKVLEKLL